MFFT
ncbi:hypothetical protein LINGRAHAP2_LOCUS721 [Linum grandiflorum]